MVILENLRHFFRGLGGYFLMVYHSCGGFKVLRRDEFFRDLEFFMIDSLLIVAIAASFTGMVASVQSAYQIKGLLPLDLLGAGVGKMITVELGPVLTALILAGRAGASIASELASMKVTEQLDAMEVMGIDPERYLIFPRIVAGVIATPLLTIFAESVALISAAVISNVSIGVDYAVFMRSFREFFYLRDLLGGIAKGIVFGFIITSISCHMGIRSSGGAKGVGLSTMQAVIYSSVVVLLFDFIVGSVFYG